ncbi:MAG TPA: hypothetical protein VFG23_03545 [Polyangia bacterium]|nr:hypothetical protein [Polyangia bacterium]
MSAAPESTFHLDLPTPPVNLPAQPTTEGAGDRALLRNQLRVVQDMLEDLEEQTAMGRRHTMEKVIVVLRYQIGRGLFRAGPRNEDILSHLVDQLAHEASRPLPELREFRDRAEPLVALLMATT